MGDPHFDIVEEPIFSILQPVKDLDKLRALLRIQDT